MFDTPMREIVPFIYKKGGKVSIINKSTVKKKKMKQKQTQKQIVNIYNTKPAARKRVYKKVEKKEEQQRMPVYYTQPSYTQYLPAPTITMPTRLPIMTPETKLPTTIGQTTGLKTSKEIGTDPDFDADFNDFMNEKQIYEQEQEEIKRKNKDYVDFLSNGNNYQDEPLPNYNYGREKLPPPNPIKPPQQEFKDPSEFDEYPDDENKEENKQDVAPSLNSDLLPSLTNDLLDIDAIKRASKNHTSRPLSLKKAQDTIMSMDLGIQLNDLKNLNATEINWYVDYLNSRIKDANRGEGQKAKGRPRKPK